MMAHPEDLAAVFDDEATESIDELTQVRRVFRESRWCLTPEEEHDLVAFCRGLDDFVITIYVYDLKCLPETPN